MPSVCVCVCVQLQGLHPAHMPVMREALPALSMSCAKWGAGSCLPPLTRVCVGARMNRVKCFFRTLKLTVWWWRRVLLVSKMEMKPKRACFLPAIEGRLVTSPRPGLSFSLADASAAGFARCVPGPQLAVVSCGDRGPFGLEISMCLWAQEHVDMLSCPLACLCSKIQVLPLAREDPAAHCTGGHRQE